MRKIYLIRHGLPHFPGGGPYCLGKADFPLDPLGRLQACQMGQGLKDEKLTVFTSPLKRAYDTAAYINPSPSVIHDLQEMHAGEWDGLSFREIKEKWPELYEARATDTLLPIPGAENWDDGQARFIKAVEAALSRSEGDIAIVAHTTVILSFICHIMGSTEYKEFRYRQSYGGYYLVTLDDEGVYHCEFPWRRPVPELDGELCRRLMAAAEAPEHIKAHCEAVASEAMELWEALSKAGLRLSKEAIYHAALLHDIARLHPDHAARGAGWLEDLGYGAVADIIRRHHDPEGTELDEAALLYMADKLVQETRTVTLRERFENSLVKCRDAEAQAAHKRRREQAQAMADRINRMCGRELII